MNDRIVSILSYLWMSNNSSQRIFGLLGNPIKHSLSPLMHNKAFSYLALNAEYRLFELEPSGIAAFIKDLSSNNICGFNVTYPYKEEILKFLDNVSEEVRIIGAVNTVRVNNRIEGFNTDCEGFLRHITKDLNFNPKDKNITILGAGGAAKAVAVSLVKNNPKSLALYDIDVQKSENLVSKLRFLSKGVQIKRTSSVEELDIEHCDLLINATPVGMKDSDPLMVKESCLHKGMLVYDLIYKPSQTLLLKAAKSRGAFTSNGLGMLLYQGVASFEIFTGINAPVDVMRKAIEEGAGKI